MSCHAFGTRLSSRRVRWEIRKFGTVTDMSEDLPRTPLLGKEGATTMAALRLTMAPGADARLRHRPNDSIP